MRELDNWRKIIPAAVGLNNIRHNVWQHVKDPDLLGYVHFQGERNGEPDPKFINRIESLKGLDHPNILKLLEYDLDAERPYMVTELCKGGTLRDIDLSEWSVSKKMLCFHKICAGFAFLWDNGLTKSDHDFKNVFLKADDTPVLGDFETGMKIEKNAEGVLKVLNNTGKFFWELMEDKEFNMLVGEQMKIEHQLFELNQQIEELEQQKTELLKNNQPEISPAG